MTEKESIETVVLLIVILIFAALIILFLISTGITSKLLGSMPWITSIIMGVLTFLGWKF